MGFFHLSTLILIFAAVPNALILLLMPIYIHSLFNVISFRSRVDSGVCKLKNLQKSQTELNWCYKKYVPMWNTIVWKLCSRYSYFSCVHHSLISILSADPEPSSLSCYSAVSVHNGVWLLVQQSLHTSLIQVVNDDFLWLNHVWQGDPIFRIPNTATCCKDTKMNPNVAISFREGISICAVSRKVDWSGI